MILLYHKICFSKILLYAIILKDKNKMKIKEIKTKSFSWLHISKPGRKEIEYLKDKYDFHPLDLEDCLVKIQRPQISEYTNHIFFILTFPVYNRKNKEIESSEIDFFISNKYIITIGDEFIPVVNTSSPSSCLKLPEPMSC